MNANLDLIPWQADAPSFRPAPPYTATLAIEFRALDAAIERYIEPRAAQSAIAMDRRRLTSGSIKYTLHTPDLGMICVIRIAISTFRDSYSDLQISAPWQRQIEASLIGAALIRWISREYQATAEADAARRHEAPVIQQSHRIDEALEWYESERAAGRRVTLDQVAEKSGYSHP